MTSFYNVTTQHVDYVHDIIFVLFGLLQSTYWLLLAFCRKILGGVSNLSMVLCHSMNAGSMVGIPWCGGDTDILQYAKEFVWLLCTYRLQGCKNCRHECLLPRATTVELSQQLIFFFLRQVSVRQAALWPDLRLVDARHEGDRPALRHKRVGAVRVRRGWVGHRDLHGAEAGECACVWRGRVGHRDLHGAEAGECMFVGEWGIETYMVQRQVTVCVQEGDIETYTVQRWVSVCVWRGTSGT